MKEILTETLRKSGAAVCDKIKEMFFKRGNAIISQPTILRHGRSLLIRLSTIPEKRLFLILM